jgi:hypothetical protein
MLFDMANPFERGLTGSTGIPLHPPPSPN